MSSIDTLLNSAASSAETMRSMERGVEPEMRGMDLGLRGSVLDGDIERPLSYGDDGWAGVCSSGRYGMDV
tara:strand:+ start:1190 stop:1399 length:210 start_codon:yes stop_codon:yes gene_type:complete